MACPRPRPLSAQMLLETLRWRAEYQPQALHWESIKHEGARGKLFVLDHPAEVRIMVIDRRVVNSAVGNTVGYAIVGAA